MHFEILVEDAFGAAAIEILLEEILGANGVQHSWKPHPYRGIGRIPKHMRTVSNPAKRLLLSQLPRILQGYGRSLDHASTAVVVVVDLDHRNCVELKRELLDVLERCQPSPNTLFRNAIEEVEAWLLGDPDAVRTAYPRARDAVLDRYAQDSICGTWEVLADAVHPGGADRLRQSGWHRTGSAKSDWARNVAPHIDVDRNRSRSFQVFRDGMLRLANLPCTAV